MLRVLLIKSNGWTCANGQPSTDVDPVEGRIYEVEKMHYALGTNFYKLKGFDDYYESRLFKPVEETWIGTLLRDIHKKAIREFQAKTSSKHHFKNY